MDSTHTHTPGIIKYLISYNGLFYAIGILFEFNNNLS